MTKTPTSDTPARDAPGVLKAHAVGAVACAACGGIHVDFADKTLAVVATGFLSFDDWMTLVTWVDRQMDEIP
jgi:hypothetical protein